MTLRAVSVVRHYGVLMGNVGARVAALGCVFLATLVIARNGGPAVVGVYALLRVLPSLLGMLTSSGLPGSVAYFLAGPGRGDRRLPLTVTAMALAGGALGAALWAGFAPLLGPVLFPELSPGLVALAGVLVVTRLVVVTAKSCCQGSEDLRGSNRVIFTEEFLFLPAYGSLWAAGVHGYAGVVGGLLTADVATSSLAWARLARRGFFRGATRPAYGLARRVAGYGLRAQVGTVISQLNLRLDFVLLGVLTGPAVVGVYAIASKFAELLRIPTMALTYVLYPRFAREGAATAAASARALAPRAGLLTAAGVLPLALAAGIAIPGLYGSEFRAAVVPTQVILLGLLLEGTAAVVTAYLYGAGRPGLNSWAMAAGLAVTVVLDLALIPPFGAVGAAAASAAAYTTSTLALVTLFWRIGRSRPFAWEEPRLARADTG